MNEISPGIFHQICQTPIDGQFLINNQANRRIVSGWLNLDEVPSLAWFIRVLEEQPQLRKSVVWQNQRFLDPKYQQQQAAAEAKQGRARAETFLKTTPYALNEANINVVIAISPASASELLQAVRDGRISLVPATPQELAQRKYDQAKAREQHLINNASDSELRQAVREERAQHAQQQQQSFQEQQLEIRRQREAGAGFPPLPKINELTGQELNARYLNNLSVEELRRYMRKYGSYQITKRLHELS